MFIPDNWIILKMLGENEAFYKILAGVCGGYLDGDAWRMNSGVKSYTEEGDYILFTGYSGSVYKCHKAAETLRMNNAFIYNRLITEAADKVSRIDYVEFKKEFNKAAK